MRNDEAPTNRRPWWALWTFLLTSPFFLLAAHFGYEDRGFAAWMFIVILGVALAANWNSRRHPRFWLIAVVLLVIHIALVVLLPWPRWHLSGAAFSPIGFFDFFVNFAVMRWMLLAGNRDEREVSRPNGIG